MNDRTAIVHHEGGGATLLGDATTLYGWKQLQLFIDLYIKTGMIPTRGVTISKMLKLATNITKKTYKNNRAGWQQASADLKVSCDTLRAAIPDVDGKGKPL